MRYFNGFALQNEEHFFKEYLVESDFTVAGFSYGAQKAFEYAYASSERIDRLILLSPAFFQNQKSSFIRTQLRYFKADQEAYTKQFLKNVSFPSSITLDDNLANGIYEELEELLNYVWDRDKIVDTEDSFEHFSDVTTTYFFKALGHLLC